MATNRKNFWFSGTGFEKPGTLFNAEQIVQRFRQAQSKLTLAEQLTQLSGGD
jgi:hypothetical protein